MTGSLPAAALAVLVAAGVVHAGDAVEFPDEILGVFQQSVGPEVVRDLRANFDHASREALLDDSKHGIVALTCRGRGTATSGPEARRDDLLALEAQVRAAQKATLAVAARSYDVRRFPQRALLVRAIQDCGFHLKVEIAPGIGLLSHIGASWIGALVRIEPGAVSAVVQQLPSPNVVEPAYARRLREAAHDALERGDGGACLAIAKELNALGSHYVDARLILDVVSAFRLTKPEEEARTEIRRLLAAQSELFVKPLASEDSARYLTIAGWSGTTAHVEVQATSVRSALFAARKTDDWPAVVRLGVALEANGCATIDSTLALVQGWIELGERRLSSEALEKLIGADLDLSRDQLLSAGHLAHRLSLFELGSRACDRLYELSRRPGE